MERNRNEGNKLFFFSIHLFDHDDTNSYEFYPGTGDEDDIQKNIINVPIAPFWRQEGGVQFGTRYRDLFPSCSVVLL